ncbi:MAG: LPS export ABC transporter periplasmic protein LptC [Azospirillum sp.]|nr:LPS export ABC transporter periplasmic protein LptC [Azospirillum sp.]
MKVTLPLIALGLVGLLAAWPKLGEVHVARATLDRGQIEMLNARYYARDEQNRPFSLTSDSAVQSQENANLTDMVNPVAEMTQVDGTWVTMRSERGRYDQSDGRLLMIDNVHVLRDDGFEFFTALANVDTKGGIAWGDAHVDGQGPSGEINADGFRVYDHGRTVVFLHSPTASVKSGDSGTASKPSNPSKPSKPAQ